MALKKYHVSLNLLNPNSKTTNQGGAERFGGEFPAGTYYIYNGFSEDIYYRDGVSATTSSTVYKNGGSVIVTATDTLVVWHSSGVPTPTIMVAESSVAIPFEPYSADVWHDIPYKRYENGDWVEYQPKKYSGGSWS